LLELNAHPERLDLLDTYCRMARDEDVLVSINSDAHSVPQFDNYALDTALPDLKRPDEAALEKAMEGHILAQAVLIGTYQNGR
jgi:hypothetical protein